MNPSQAKKLVHNHGISRNERELREFTRSLPMSLLKAREAVMKKFVPSLREHGLSPQQWRVIRALEEDKALELTELAEICFILKPSLTRIVQNLEARKLIKRIESKVDRRRSAVSLTASGRQLFEKVAPASAERYDFITERFGFGKMELLYELLDELISAVQEESDSQHSDED